MNLPDPLAPALASLVASVAHPPADPTTLRESSVLLESGLDLDSLALLELVVGLETWGIAVPAADVGPQNFRTFGALLAYVRARAGSSA